MRFLGSWGSRRNTPVIGLFLLLASIIIVRYKDPYHLRSFYGALYPLAPLLFSGHASICCMPASYTGKGALVGAGVLLTGLCVWLLFEKRTQTIEQD